MNGPLIWMSWFLANSCLGSNYFFSSQVWYICLDLFHLSKKRHFVYSKLNLRPKNCLLEIGASNLERLFRYKDQGSLQYIYKGQSKLKLGLVEMSYWYLQFLPKKKPNHVELRFHRSKVKFVDVLFLEEKLAWKNQFDFVWPLDKNNLLVEGIYQGKTYFDFRVKFERTIAHSAQTTTCDVI